MIKLQIYLWYVNEDVSHQDDNFFCRFFHDAVERSARQSLSSLRTVLWAEEYWISNQGVSKKMREKKVFVGRKA